MKNLKEHLFHRHLNIDLHRPVIDDEGQVITFYLWNLSGQLVGFQQYRPSGVKHNQNNPREGKYFTYHKKGVIAVWGIESLYLTPNILFLTEGIFDAARLTERGYSAIAVLSNSPTPDLFNWLSCLNRKIIAVCDNDIAGHNLAKFGDIAIFTKEKDLGDSSDDDVNEILKPFKEEQDR